jgi:integrase/recombinase XerC
MEITVEQVNQIIREIKVPSVKLIAKTMYCTGMRVDECTHLEVNDVDFERNVINVVNGSNRSIPIVGDFREELLHYKETVRPLTHNNHFFVSEKGNSVTRKYLSNIINKTATNLGLQGRRRITCHILRREFISNLIREGVDHQTIAKLLGHRTLPKFFFEERS